MSWIIQNIGTIIVSLVLLSIITLIVVKLIRDKRKGVSSCGCGCSDCPSKCVCRNKPER